LKYLADFAIDEAELMLTNKKWTRAIFLRDPKGRVLSAFLNKAAHGNYFKNNCCQCKYRRNETLVHQCAEDGKVFKNFLSISMSCMDKHWLPQSPIVGKFWPFINFVRYFETLQLDTEKLLRSLEGKTWEQFGATGWGKNGTQAIFSENPSYHKCNACDNMKKHYTEKLEKLVEERK